MMDHDAYLKKYVPLLASSFISLFISMIVFLLFHSRIRWDWLAGLVVLMFAAVPFGEYILPFLLHLSPELYSLNDRVSESMGKIQGRATLPESWRIFVGDEDVQMITALGHRTLIVTRGCFNMRQEEFVTALSEAIEQQKNRRSYVLLLATIGNPIFLFSRLFCFCGRIVIFLASMPILLILAVLSGVFCNSFFSSLFVGKTLGSAIWAVNEKIYLASSWCFMLLGNASLLIYSPVLFWMDRQIDRILVDRHQGAALKRIIQKNVSVEYHGEDPREYCVILRLGAEKRISSIANTYRSRQSGRSSIAVVSRAGSNQERVPTGSQASQTVQNWEPATSTAQTERRHSGHSIRIVE